MRRLFELDRHMFAFQAGVSGAIPFLPFASASFSYTKIEPYTYTHTRVINPWNNDPAELSYTNNGASLGYYLPPNSDEIKFRFDVLPAPRTKTHLQYQMIRHGADYGNSAVDGSSLLSELASAPFRSGLKKDFLHDGAYEWMHVVKVGGEHTFTQLALLPFTMFAEVGIVFSYFTNTDGVSREYQIIDTVEYPKSTSFIINLGIRMFL
jgi:hypothetical protein